MPITTKHLPASNQEAYRILESTRRYVEEIRQQFQYPFGEIIQIITESGNFLKLGLNIVASLSENSTVILPEINQTDIGKCATVARVDDGTYTLGAIPTNATIETVSSLNLTTKSLNVFMATSTSTWGRV